MEKKKIPSVKFLYDWYMLAKPLMGNERLELYDTILGYIYDDNEDVSQRSSIVQTIFKMILPQIKKEIGVVTDALETPVDAKKEKDTLFEECWVAYRRKGVKKKALEYWKKLNDDEKQLVMPHIKAYVSSRGLVFQRDFERYLRDKLFLSIVVVDDKIIYDPQRNANDVYAPQGFGIWYDNETKSYWTNDTFYDHILYDGYSDDTRPNGAKITLSNGRGTFIWNSLTKEWEKQIIL